MRTLNLTLCVMGGVGSSGKGWRSIALDGDGAKRVVAVVAVAVTVDAAPSRKDERKSLRMSSSFSSF